MKLATRLNSFLRKDISIDKAFESISENDIRYVDLNYPEHVKDITPSEMTKLLKKHNLKANGIALRFRDKFVNGELGNSNESISNDALNLCKEAIDYCRAIEGEVVTIWLGYDGFDYSFQIDYVNVWERLVECYQEIADYAQEIKVSIEYKPFQPRAYAFVEGMGVTGMLLNDINRSNVGVTLDYCHMLMKHENPAFAADIFGSKGKLYGVHLNDGYGLNDDGLMIGSVTPFQTLEFLFYLKKHSYNGIIYFDTFPVIEDASEECRQNINMLTYLNKLIDCYGIENIQEIINENDAIKVNRMLLEFLKLNYYNEAGGK